MSYQHPTQAIEELCKLQAEVAYRVHGYKHAADCFCGTRQRLVDEGLWQNDGIAIDYIKQAVHEKIERDTKWASLGPEYVARFNEE